jgi:hypothetical protein
LEGNPFLENISALVPIRGIDPNDDRGEFDSFAGVTTFAEQVLAAFDGRGNDHAMSVPIGSEQAAANYLAKRHIILAASLISAGCGGAETIWFSIPKRRAPRNFARPDVFEAMLKTALNKYANSGSLKGSVSVPSQSISPLEPHYATERFTIVVPSEISRGPRQKGVWDQFDAIFSISSETSTEFIVAAFTENIANAPISPLHSDVPSEEHFNSPPRVYRYVEEHTAAASLIYFLGRDKKHCRFEMEGDNYLTDLSAFPCSTSDDAAEQP